MKLLRKYSTILITLLVIALVVIKLFANKSKLDNELKAMQEYSSVIPVEIIAPKKLTASRTLEESGVLRAGARIEVLSETSGKVIKVSGNIGDRVQAGQTIVMVEKEVLESQFKMAKATLDNALNDLNRFNTLIGEEAITQQQLEAAKLNYQNALTNFTSIKKQLENTNIAAPVNGFIAERKVEKGAFITPAMPVFTILEQNKMLFVVKVAESELGLLDRNQVAKIKIDAFPAKEFTGTIRSIGITSDQSGRYEVEISVSGSEIFLRAGMSGKAFFENSLKDSGVIIPRKCILGSVKEATVFILQGDSVTARSVKALSINEMDVLITDGLSATEKVVLSGQINLQNGSKVKVINQ